MQNIGNTGARRGDDIRSILQARVGEAMRVVNVLRSAGSEHVVQAHVPGHPEEVFLRLFVADPTIESESSTRACASFVRRAENVAGLDHPSVVESGSLQQGEGFAYYVLFDSSEATLESLLGAAQPLSLERSLVILREVASALDFASSKGVVHGQLDPSVILLDPDGGASVADFAVGGALPLSRSRRRPAYLAPEQWEVGAKTDARTDVYALGVIAYELITGQLRAVTIGGPGIVIVDPLPITHDLPLRPGLGLHINQALLRAVAKRAPARFGSAGEFISMLENGSRVVAPGLPTERPPLNIDRPSQIRLLPTLFVAAMGIALGVVGVPAARRLQHRPDSFSSILDDVKLRLPSLRGHSEAPLESSNSAGTAPDYLPPSGTNSSSSVTASSGAPAAPAPRTPPGDSARPDAAAPRFSSASPPFTERTSEGDVRPSSAQPGSPPASARAGAGFLRVEVEGQGALVLVDDISRGGTPFVGAVSPGTHSVQLIGVKATSPLRTFRVTAGDTTVASFEQP